MVNRSYCLYENVHYVKNYQGRAMSYVLQRPTSRPWIPEADYESTW